MKKVWFSAEIPGWPQMLKALIGLSDYSKDGLKTGIRSEGKMDLRGKR